LISGKIIGQIQGGSLSAGDAVPSENEIIAAYGVSNTTARKVLQEIEREGWVTRIKGRGTFVREGKVERSADRILSFTKNMRACGLEPSTRVLDIRVLQKGRTILLGRRKCQLTGPIVRIERLRLADGVPMMKEMRFISSKLCPGIERKDLTGSLYDIYEKAYGYQLKNVDQIMSAVMMDRKSDMSLFEIEDPIPAFFVEGATFCGKDVVLEMEESLYRGDQYRFEVRATSRQ
jgi:GntR family transcriptional regulator